VTEMSALTPLQAYSDVVLAKNYQLASVVILFFDYFITLDLEWENIWRRRWTLATFLFFINRYFPMLSYIVVVVSLHDPSWSQQSCETFVRLPFYMVLISETVIAMVVCLRLYALYLGRWHVPVGLAMVYVIQLVFALLGSRGLTLATGLPAGTGCVANVESWALTYFATYIGISAVFDCVVFSLTLIATLRYRPQGIKVPIADLFLRDGILYFAVMFTAKVVNFVVFWTVSRNLLTINWTLNHTITVIMISRLILNIRAHDTLRRKASGTSATYESISVVFASFLGNLGTPVEPVMPEEDTKVEDDGFPVAMRWPGRTDGDGLVNWGADASVQTLSHHGSMV